VHTEAPNEDAAMRLDNVQRVSRKLEAEQAVAGRQAIGFFAGSHTRATADAPSSVNKNRFACHFSISSEQEAD
jgi:transposase-like protein